MCKVTGDDVLIMQNFPALGIEKGNLYEAFTGMLNKLVIPDPIDFIIGDGKTNTPLANTNTYQNSFLEGRRFYIIRNGAGKLHVGINYTVLPAGGFQLMEQNDIFVTGEEWSIIFY